MNERISTQSQGSEALSLRGAILLGAVVWLLLAGAMLACFTKSRLTRPIGGYGGSCLSGVGGDCMTALVQKQQAEDLQILLTVAVLSAIPAWSLAFWCYRAQYPGKKVFRWSVVGALSIVLIVTVFPVAFALVLLDFNPAVALRGAQFVRGGPSFVNKIPIRVLDWRVLSASKHILASDDFIAQSALAQYAGSGQSGEEWRDILLTIANSNTPSRGQALVCLGWRGDPRNLQFLGERLFIKDDPTTSVQYVLMAQYGKEGEAYVQRCLTESPHIQTREECARVLASRGKPEAFKFYLDELNRSDARGRSRILQNMRNYARNGEMLNEKLLPEFLAKRAKK